MGATAIETRHLQVPVPFTYPVTKEQILKETQGTTVTTLDGHQYISKQNATAKESAPQRIRKVLESDGWRALKLGEGFGNFGTEIAHLNGREVPLAVTNMTKAFGQTWRTLGMVTAVTMVISASKDVFEAVSKDTRNLPDKWREQKMWGALQKVIGAISMIFYALTTFFGFLPGNKALADNCKNWGDSTDGVENFFGIRQSIRSIANAQDLASKTANNEKLKDLHQNAVSTARLNTIRAAKQICSIAGCIFAMALLIVGIPIVATIYSIGIALVGSMLALYASFYDKSAKFKELKFHDVKSHTLAQSV